MWNRPKKVEYAEWQSQISKNVFDPTNLWLTEASVEFNWSLSCIPFAAICPAQSLTSSSLVWESRIERRNN